LAILLVILAIAAVAMRSPAFDDPFDGSQWRYGLSGVGLYIPDAIRIDPNDLTS
jgi:hypothetical protein